MHNLKVANRNFNNAFNTLPINNSPTCALASLLQAMGTSKPCLLDASERVRDSRGGARMAARPAVIASYSRARALPPALGRLGCRGRSRRTQSCTATLRMALRSSATPASAHFLFKLHLHVHRPLFKIWHQTEPRPLGATLPHLLPRSRPQRMALKRQAGCGWPGLGKHPFAADAPPPSACTTQRAYLEDIVALA